MKLKYLFLALIVPCLISCQKEITGDLETVPPPDNEDAQAYYSAVIGGQSFSEKVTGNDDTNFFTATSSDADPELLSAVINEAVNGTGLIISKGVFPDFENATPATLKAFFSPGLYNYADVDSGIRIAWLDAQGNEWSTVASSGDQSGSVFEIKSANDAHDGNGNYYVLIEAVFNCNLYNDNNEKKVLTGGKYKGFFGPVEP